MTYRQLQQKLKFLGYKGPLNRTEWQLRQAYCNLCAAPRQYRNGLWLTKVAQVEDRTFIYRDDNGNDYQITLPIHLGGKR